MSKIWPGREHVCGEERTCVKAQTWKNEQGPHFQDYQASQLAEGCPDFKAESSTCWEPLGLGRQGWLVTLVSKNHDEWYPGYHWHLNPALLTSPVQPVLNANTVPPCGHVWSCFQCLQSEIFLSKVSFSSTHPIIASLKRANGRLKFCLLLLNGSHSFLIIFW